MVDQYIFSGSLPENASTYVTRTADEQLYLAVLQGKFCYVLNSRQSGKSSLRVRTMSRLGEAGVECASIDLSSINIQTATPENWYADLIVKLIDSFILDVDFKDWWEQNQFNSPLLRFSNFLTKILLNEISENIVIFIDEIDSVLSLNFPTDDFFAFIRSCYNLRVDNPKYNRLTFCLLGVASPTSLIQDKQRTPFNIGQAVSLKGFQQHEVEPLEKGLRGKFSNPQAIMQEILQWTGGQPFLTQKLCQYMVEESEQENPRSVEQVVRSRIIENWESQDEPEHLRTIQARILRDEQRAGYLLELYQQVRLAKKQSQVIANETLEQSELQLSGLVVRQQEYLRIYNQIYREIFNFNWIETQLNNLRPYSENFRFWLASGGTDESRLLRGKALKEAEEWARDKNLSYQDKQFLAASKEKEIQEEIAAKQQEAALERERQDKEAAQERNQLLSEANKKAQRRISIGVVVLVVAVLGAATVGLSARKQVEVAHSQVNNARKDLAQAQQKTQEAEGNERKARDSVAQAKEQEQQAKGSEKLAKKTAMKAGETARKAQQQAKTLQKNATKFEQDAARAIQDLEKAKNQKLDIGKQLQIINDRLKNVNIINKETEEEVSAVQQLNKQYEELLNQKKKYSERDSSDDFFESVPSKLFDLSFDSNEALRLSALSFNINNHQLKQALVFAARAQASQQLKNLKEAKQEIYESQKFLLEADKKALNSSEGLQIQVLFQQSKGSLLAQEKQSQKAAIECYTIAFYLLKKYPERPDYTKKNQLVTAKNIESVHRQLINLLTKINTEEELKKQVEESLTQHLYAQLEYYLKAKNWKYADYQTSRLILNIAKREEKNYLETKDIDKFSCKDLRRIDTNWKNYSDGHFGFGVQKQIWENLTGNWRNKYPKNSLENLENSDDFLRMIGWLNGDKYRYHSEIWRLLDNEEDYRKTPKGMLPILEIPIISSWQPYLAILNTKDQYLTSFFSRTCL